MKRTIFLTAGLAGLLMAISLDAGHRGGGGGGGFRSGGGGTAHVGSVHYGGGGGGPVGGAPVVAPGAVRSEHYGYGDRGFGDRGWGERGFGGGFGGYRNPYRDDYFRLFPPGWRTMLLNDALYYMYDTLPVGCPSVIINGITYYSCGGIYYQPYLYNGQTVYMVAPM